MRKNDGYSCHGYEAGNTDFSPRGGVKINDDLLFSRFDFYWAGLIFVSILSFGFFLTNHSVGIDDEIIELYSGYYNMVMENRIGRIISGSLFHTFDYLPFWREFLGVFLYVIGTTLHVQNFIKYLKFDKFTFDKKSALIFSSIAVSFPYIAFHMIFMLTCLEQGINMLISALAVDCFYKYFSDKKKKYYLIICVILLAFILSVYEIGLLFFLISCCFIQLINLIFNKAYLIKNFQKELCSSFAICASGLSIVYLLVFVSKKILNIAYERMEEFCKYDFSSLNEFIISFKQNMVYFIRGFINTLHYNFGSVVIVLSALIFISFILFYTLKKKNLYIIIAGLILSLLPLSVLFITGNPNLPYRDYSAFSFFCAIAVTVLYTVFKNNKILSRIIVLIVGLIVLYQSQEMNQIFYTENIKFENDKHFAYMIMYDLKRLNLEEKPVVFTGLREHLKFKTFYEEAAELNLSIFNWDRYDFQYNEIFVVRPFFFMNGLGFDIKSLYQSDILNEVNKEEFINEVILNTKSMNIYPVEGSIRDMGNYVIIKIGKSKADDM